MCTQMPSANRAVRFVLSGLVHGLIQEMEQTPSALDRTLLGTSSLLYIQLTISAQTEHLP